MREFLRVRGLVPSCLLYPRLARVLAIGLVGAGASACATQQAPNYAGAHQPAPQRVSERQWKVEIEEDGKPAQAPPARAMRPEEDDPSQPWSPNYGKPPSEWRKPAPVGRTATPPLIETSVRTAAVATDQEQGPPRSKAPSPVLRTSSPQGERTQDYAPSNQVWPSPLGEKVAEGRMRGPLAGSVPSRQLSAAEADTVILRAIQNHEALRP